MITYLLDTSVILEFYKPKATFPSAAAFERSNNLKAILMEQKGTNNAIMFVPSFCIAEVKNTMARWFYREKVWEREDLFLTCMNTFGNHITNRKTFYCYDLNRYHNLNCTEISKVEHTTETEYMVSGLSHKHSKVDIQAALHAKDRETNLGKYYLSSFDILIIAAGMEIKRMTNREVYLLTNDKRLSLITSQRADSFPKPLLWNDITPNILKTLPAN
jgi:hypothetical protein